MIDSRLRRYSHWSAKLVTRRRERGSASIRRTCRSSTAGLCSSPAIATSSSSSSGMLLQRKNESRDASSRSLIAVGRVRRRRRRDPARRGTGTAGSPAPRSAPSRCPPRSRRRARACDRTSSALRDRLGDRPPIGPAHQRRRGSVWRSAPPRPRLAGSQTKIRRRLGVSPGPFASYGPMIETE